MSGDAAELLKSMARLVGELDDECKELRKLQMGLLELVKRIGNTVTVKRELRIQEGTCTVCGGRGSIRIRGHTWPCPRCKPAAGRADKAGA